MANIKIITDSGSDITQEEAKQYNIDVLPFIIQIDGEEYRTGVDITSEEFYEKLKTCEEIPATAQLTPDELLGVFRGYAQEGYEVLFFTISSNATGTYNNALLAKRMLQEEMPDAVVEVIDSQSFTYHIAYAAIHAAKLAQEGNDIETVKIAAIELLQSYDVFIAAQSLKYLEKGGRINKASLVMGNVLDIRPLLSIRNGLIEAIGTMRGSKKIVSKMVKKLEESGFDQTGKTMLIVQGDMKGEAEEMKALVAEKLSPKEIIIRDVGPTIATHIGPVIAVFFAVQ